MNGIRIILISLLITFFFFLEVRGNQAGFPTRGEPDEGMILCENNNLMMRHPRMIIIYKTMSWFWCSRRYGVGNVECWN